MLLSISASDLHTGKRVWVLSGQVCFNFLQGYNSMDLCCISCMVLSVFSRLVVANFLFSLRDINLTLGLLPPEDTWYGLILWVLRVLGYFSPEFSLVVTPYRRAPKRAKQLSMATIPLCFEFFRCRVDVLQS